MDIARGGFEPAGPGSSLSNACYVIYIYFEQVGLMLLKHVSQKKRNGRQTLKDTIMIQFFLLAFITYILYAASQIYPSADEYGHFPLPPLSDDKPYGIFNKGSKGNTYNSIISKRLYYSPAGHDGIESLINALTAKYPDIKAIGTTDRDGILDLYEKNIFDTWATIEFQLTETQKSTGKLVTSTTTEGTVNYIISINPVNYGGALADFNYTSDVYNKQSTDADIFWSSGYMTLQNFIDTYLAQQYTNKVSSDYTVSRFTTSCKLIY